MFFHFPGPGMLNWISWECPQIQGDLADIDAVTDALKGMDTVFHTAAKPGIWGTYDEYFRVNVTGTVNVIDACMKNKVARLVHTSSPSVVFDDKDMHGADESAPYPDTYLAPYPETKALAEKEVIQAAGQGLCARHSASPSDLGARDNHLVPGINQPGQPVEDYRPGYGSCGYHLCG